MTIQQIRYVIGIADAGSFNKAAEKLFISQPSLTSSVHDLEYEIGFQIFNRTARGITLTEKGKEFLDDAKTFFQNFLTLQGKYTKQEKKSFSVSTLYYAFARKAFVQVVEKFGSQGFDFAFREKKALDVIADVSNGNSEIGLLYLSDSNRDEISKMINVSNLEFHHLTECNAFVYLHKNHPLSKKASLSLEDLINYRFVTFDNDDVKSFFTDDVISRFSLDKAITVADRSTELNLLKTLDGYTFLSGIFGEETNEDFLLIPLKNLEDDGICKTFELGYITRKNEKMYDISLTYIDNIRRILHLAGFAC